MDLRSIKYQPNLLIRIIIYVSNLYLLWLFFPPMYYKNDDVIMSMIAGGYGTMYEKSEIMFHSNIIIGFITKNLPVIFDIQPYNLFNAILIIYIFVCIQEITFYILEKFWLATLVSNSILFFLAVTPTFSTIAGGITVIGIITIAFYAKNGSLRLLIFGLLNILIASLIRDEQMLFTLIILIVFFQILFKKSKKEFYVATIIFLFLFGGSQLINRFSYESDALKDLVEFESVRYSITDYGADNAIIQNSLLLNDLQLSQNDIKLIRNWYFFDSNLANVGRLKTLLDNSNWGGPFFNTNFTKIFRDSSDLLTTYPINILFLCYTVLFFMGIREKKIVYSFFVLLFLVLVGAIIGRQLNYIYYPVIIGQLLLFIHLISWNKTRYLILFTATILILFFHIFENAENKREISKAQRDFMTLGIKEIWMIGGGWSLQHIYPLLDTQSWRKDLKIISSDWSIYAEKSNARILNNKNGFIDTISSNRETYLVANNFHIPLLEKYCLEKFGNRLKVNKFKENTFVQYYGIDCAKSKVNLIGKSLEFDQEGNPFLWITRENQSFYLSNYSDSNFNGKIPVYIFNNPCKNELDFQLIVDNFIYNYKSTMTSLFVDLNLKSFEKTEIRILPLTELSCNNYKSDARDLLFKFSLIKL